uniref:Uncharacterized protein n=1 Tax=Anguilla anguilla TaxID=7936 RepID=A0A0E9TD61_ANGAN
MFKYLLCIKGHALHYMHLADAHLLSDLHNIA